MEWESDSPCRSHIYPRRWSGWELELRDCEAIPGWGLLLIAREGLSGCEGEDCGGKRLWRKARQPWNQGDTCWVTHGSGSITIAGAGGGDSLSPPTCQHWQLNNREAGPSKAWRSDLQSRTPGGGLPMCLMHQTTERDPRQGSPLSAWTDRVMEKDWPKRPSNRQLQEAWRKILIGP